MSFLSREVNGSLLIKGGAERLLLLEPAQWWKKKATHPITWRFFLHAWVRLTGLATIFILPTRPCFCIMFLANRVEYSFEILTKFIFKIKKNLKNVASICIHPLLDSIPCSITFLCNYSHRSLGNIYSSFADNFENYLKFWHIKI